jgi:NitT/TauT family transport system substrate-binding protein
MTRPITLYENLRTVVYTPFYLAIARGEWAREGISVEARLSPATTETAEGLIAGRADVSWGGPMTTTATRNARWSALARWWRAIRSS